MTEVEAEEHLLNCVKISQLGDAGGAIIVSFFIRVINIMRITGKVGTGKVEIQNILLPMIPGTIHQEWEDLLHTVLILLEESVGGGLLADMPMMVLLIVSVKGLQMMSLEKGKIIGIETYLLSEVVSLNIVGLVKFLVNFLLQEIVVMGNFAGFLIILGQV